MVADRRYFALCLHFPNSSLLLFNGFFSSLNRIIVFSIVHNLQFFDLKKYETSTSLSKYIWKLKSEDKPFNIDWSIEASAPAYNPASKKCRLCTMEKTIILFREEGY